MMKNEFLKIFGALAAVVMLGIAAPAAIANEHHPGHPGPGHQKEMGSGMGIDHKEWLEKLNLTKEQKQQVEKVREAQKGQMKAKMELARTEHEKLHTMMQGDASDADLRAQHEKVMALHAEAGKERFESMLKIRAILTPEQRKKMGELHRDGPMGKGHPCGDMKMGAGRE